MQINHIQLFKTKKLWQVKHETIIDTYVKRSFQSTRKNVLYSYASEQKLDGIGYFETEKNGIRTWEETKCDTNSSDSYRKDWILLSRGW